MQTFLKSPDQASRIFGLDGNTVPRKRSLFFVNFIRTANSQSNDTWQNNLSFIVKSVNRPAVRPQIEEVNQYNKRRQITTGFKLEPVRIEFYDTADSMAMRMWDEYSRYYFGDFSQEDPTMFYSDVTLPTMFDNGSGFGYVPQDSSNDSIDINSQFFFDVIEVYQVFAGYFVQFNLVNPKITEFTPDQLDYSTTEPSLITMSLAYEALLYQNGSRPQPLSQSQVLSAAFNGQFDGNVVNVPGAMGRTNSFNPGATGVTPIAQLDPRLQLLNTVTGLQTNTGSLGGGALAMFGNYNFGVAAPTLINGASGDASYAALSNPALAVSLSLPTNNNTPITPVNPQQSVPGALFDSTSGTLSGISGGNQFASQYVQANLTPGVAASTIASGTSAIDQTQATAGGLTLSNQSYGIINAQRPSSSQLGVNSDNTPSTPPAYNDSSSSSVPDSPGIADILDV